jgi:hypothetical protein
MRLALLIILISTSLFSELVTIETKNGSSELYYKLGTGVTAEVSNDNWHLAFNGGLLGGTIRSNKNVTVYESTTLDYLNFGDPIVLDDLEDQTKFSEVFNQYDEWRMGAFNIGGQPGGFSEDYGWGEYVQGEGIIGIKLYVLKIANGNGNVEYKQLLIDEMSSGSYFLKFSDLDGSNQTDIVVKKEDFDGKLFGYLNVLTGEFLNNQPLISEWDFVIREYKDLLDAGPDSKIPYNVVGLLQNDNVWVAEQSNEKSSVPELSEFSRMVDKLGWDWKTFTTSYEIEPYSYFLQNIIASDGGQVIGNGPIYKLDFISYTGIPDKIVEFEINAISTSVEEEANFGIYPNIVAANSSFTLVHSTQGTRNISIVNMQGSTVFSTQITGNGRLAEQNISISNLETGLYLIKFDDLNSALKLIIK